LVSVSDVDDPRDPALIPSGTSEANAKAFLALPVGLTDEAPLGGIGQGGVHIDRFNLGNAVDKGSCSGKTGPFSVAARDKVFVCFRVVQRRKDNTVSVLWQKDGKTVRRKMIALEPTHALRTRAGLALRDEYVGNWTATVFAEDDVALATATFTVVP
jgi:hypothetical protein